METPKPTWRTTLINLISQLYCLNNLWSNEWAVRLTKALDEAKAEVLSANDRAKSAQEGLNLLQKDYEALTYKATSQDKTICELSRVTKVNETTIAQQASGLRLLEEERASMRSHISLLDWIVYVLYARIDEASEAPLSEVADILDGCNDRARSSVPVKEVTETVAAIVQDELENGENEDALREFDALMKEFITHPFPVFETKRQEALNHLDVLNDLDMVSKCFPILKFDPAKVNGDTTIATIFGGIGGLCADEAKRIMSKCLFGNAGIL